MHDHKKAVLVQAGVRNNFYYSDYKNYYNNYKLVVCDKNVGMKTLTSFIPSNVTEGYIVSITSASHEYKITPIVSGEAIVASEILFETNQTGGAGVMLGVKILKCKFHPNKSFTTSGGTECITNTNLVFAPSV